MKKRVKLYLDPDFLRILRKVYLPFRERETANPPFAGICRIILLQYLHDPEAAKAIFREFQELLPPKYTKKVIPITMELPLHIVDHLNRIKEHYPFQMPLATLVHLILGDSLGYSVAELVSAHSLTSHKTQEEILQEEINTTKEQEAPITSTTSTSPMTFIPPTTQVLGEDRFLI